MAVRTRALKPAETEKADLILRKARKTRTSHREQCDVSRKARRKAGGALTEAEQDLLRSMLVFAAAGLDSLLKQLIRDTLHTLSDRDPYVALELEKFVARQLRGDADGGLGDAASGRRFLARVLVTPRPLGRITEEYIRDLTGESLQSTDQLFRASRALGVDPDTLELDVPLLNEIFKARNQIIHEMDISLEAAEKKGRKRRSRTTEDMTAKADYLLAIGAKLLAAVEKKLPASR